jgi:hypothetical protein
MRTAVALLLLALATTTSMADDFNIKCTLDNGPQQGIWLKWKIAGEQSPSGDHGVSQVAVTKDGELWELYKSNNPNTYVMEHLSSSFHRFPYCGRYVMITPLPFAFGPVNSCFPGTGRCYQDAPWSATEEAALDKLSKGVYSEPGADNITNEAIMADTRACRQRCHDDFFGDLPSGLGAEVYDRAGEHVAECLKQCNDVGNKAVAEAKAMANVHVDWTIFARALAAQHD